MSSDPAYPPPAYPDKSNQPPPGPPGYAPPPQQPAYGQGYGPPPGQAGSSSTTVVMMGGGTNVVSYGEQPMSMCCPHCRAQIVTRVEYQVGTFTWVFCLLLCLIGCDLGCCFIPFCCDGAKDANHYCPNCQQYLGAFHRM